MKTSPPLPATRASQVIAVAIVGAATVAAAGQPTALPLPGSNGDPPAAESPGPASAVDSVIGGDLSLQQREDRLAALLDRSVADGSLGRDEYRHARVALAAIGATENRLRHRNQGELTDTETFRLESRIKALAGSIRWKP